jgi:hypothetical protein
VLSGDIYRLTLRACGSAFLAGLLVGSDISFTVCAITFLSSRSFVGSRYASASRIGRDTAFHARSIILAPSLWNFSRARASLTTPPGATPSDEDANAAANWNIDRLYADEQPMEEAGEYWRALSEGRPPVDAQAATMEELEAEASWTQNNLKAVLDRYAPEKTARARSKKWWTEEIKQERRLFGGARRTYKNSRISFDEYCRVRNEYYRHIRKAKRLAWERFLEGVFPTDDHSDLATDPERCWKALRYTKPQVPSHTPAIKVGGEDGRPDTMVATAEEKEEIFMAQAFPSQIGVGGEIPFPSSVADVSASEVREALFAQSVKTPE